jgi:UDP-N-acetylglucosamine--N-acetylmuramyl-(pentapeptide) pyrophosphoryl-undecaprenol N-acetylglucosamine transferase
VILHESNALPGKVTRWLSPWCTQVALGFEVAARYLPNAQTVTVGTPVRAQFQTDLGAGAGASAGAVTNLPPLDLLQDLDLPPEVPVILVVGGSQGAVAVNRLVRQAAAAWFAAGAWVVHLTGDSDPEANQLSHAQYRALPFYVNMAGLLRRATLAISRAGAGTLTELAITATPAILIPYPYAAEDHQTYNAKVFEAAGAALLMPQSDLTAERLEQQVLTLLGSPELQQMATAAQQLATPDSAELLSALVRQSITAKN